MFILQAFKPENKFWKYILGCFIVIIASFAGQIPLGIVIAVKAMASGGSMPTNEAQMYKFMDLNLTLFLVLLSFAIGLLGLLLVVKNLHKQKIRELITSRPKVDWKRFFFAFVIWGLFSVVSTVVAYFIAPEDYVVQFDPTKFAILFAIAIIMIPIQTSTEELLFRGYLMQGLGLLARNRWLPLVVTSIVFGAMHLFNPEVEKMGPLISIYYIGTGFCLGIMTLMDEGTELSLGFHAANNLVAALLITADWTALQTNSILKDISDPSAGLEIILPLVIVYPILLFIFAKKYKWSGWKEKLTGKIVLPELETTHPNYKNNG